MRLADILLPLRGKRRKELASSVATPSSDNLSIKIQKNEPDLAVSVSKPSSRTRSSSKPRTKPRSKSRSKSRSRSRKKSTESLVDQAADTAPRTVLDSTSTSTCTKPNVKPKSNKILKEERWCRTPLARNTDNVNIPARSPPRSKLTVQLTVESTPTIKRRRRRRDSSKTGRPRLSEAEDDETLERHLATLLSQRTSIVTQTTRQSTISSRSESTGGSHEERGIPTSLNPSQECTFQGKLEHSISSLRSASNHSNMQEQGCIPSQPKSPRFSSHRKNPMLSPKRPAKPMISLSSSFSSPKPTPTKIMTPKSAKTQIQLSRISTPEHIRERLPIAPFASPVKTSVRDCAPVSPRRTTSPGRRSSMQMLSPESNALQKFLSWSPTPKRSGFVSRLPPPLMDEADETKSQDTPADSFPFLGKLLVVEPEADERTVSPISVRGRKRAEPRRGKRESYLNAKPPHKPEPICVPETFRTPQAVRAPEIFCKPETSRTPDPIHNDRVHCRLEAMFAEFEQQQEEALKNLWDEPEPTRNKDSDDDDDVQSLREEDIFSQAEKSFLETASRCGNKSPGNSMLQLFGSDANLLDEGEKYGDDENFGFFDGEEEISLTASSSHHTKSTDPSTDLWQVFKPPGDYMSVVSELTESLPPPGWVLRENMKRERAPPAVPVRCRSVSSSTYRRQKWAQSQASKPPSVPVRGGSVDTFTLSTLSNIDDENDDDETDEPHTNDWSVLT